MHEISLVLGLLIKSGLPYGSPNHKFAIALLFALAGTVSSVLALVYNILTVPL